jgi:hypothetical protein
VLLVSSSDDALERGLLAVVVVVVEVSSTFLPFLHSRSFPGPDFSDAKDVRMGFDVRFEPNPGSRA